MNETQDNKMEDLFFGIIMGNNVLIEEILQLHNLIVIQKIADDDKTKINQKIFGVEYIITKEAMPSLIRDMRDARKGESLLYQLFFDVLEKTFNISDLDNTYFLQSETNLELEADIIIVLEEVLNDIYIKLRDFLENKKSINEIFSSDYLDDDELAILESEIEWMFEATTQSILDSDAYERIKQKTSHDRSIFDEITEL